MIETLALELGIANCQHFIDKQDLRLHVHGTGDSQPDDHAGTGGAYSPFTARKALSHTLRQIVARQSRQVMQPVSRPRSLRRICFLASLGCLWLYLFQTRTRWVKQR